MCFPDFLDIVNGLALWSAQLQLADKTHFGGRDCANKHIIWVTDIEAHSVDLLSDKTNRNQATDKACTAQVATRTAWIPCHAGHGNMAAIVDWAHGAEMENSVQVSNTKLPLPRDL